MFVRLPDSRFNLANFMRVHLYTALGALRVGMDILFKEEGVKLDSLLGHGGLFKTKGVGQRIMAAAAGVPVTVMETAGEVAHGARQSWLPICVTEKTEAAPLSTSTWQTAYLPTKKAWLWSRRKRMSAASRYLWSGT